MLWSSQEIALLHQRKCQFYFIHRLRHWPSELIYIFVHKARFFFVLYSSVNILTEALAMPKRLLNGSLDISFGSTQDVFH